MSGAVKISRELINVKLEASSNATNPVIKFIAIIAIAVYYFMITDLYRMYLLIFAILIYYNFKALPYQVAKPKYRFLIIFSLLIVIVQLAASRQGDLVFFLIPKIFNLGPFFPIYQKGLFYAILFVGRFWGVITISWVFIDSTNPFDFAQSLTNLKVPYRLAYSLSLALRFTPVLNNEITVIRNAQQTRGLNSTPNSIKGTYNLLKFTLFPIISSTLNRIKDITLSMEGRAFGLYVDRTPLKEIPLQILDIIKLFVLILLLMLLLMF
ncbi:MAG: energy-coupling factor transporter transmembrane component T family protein [Candidatus Hodarchaeales archaeon]|jgi:energy-coupling factor transport system permease protein